MLRRRYTRLSEIQQRLVSILLATFVVLLVNSLLLLLFDRSTAATYMVMVLLHIVLGVLLLLPVLIFLPLHVLRMPVSHNRGATAAGVITATSAGALLASGFALVTLGASYSAGWILWLHIAATFTSLTGFILHVSLKKGVSYHFLEWRERWHQGPRRVIQHPLNAVVVITLAISAVFFISAWNDRRDTGFLHAENQSSLAPAQAVLAHPDFLADDDLTRSETCGQAGCHPDIYAQWRESVHHFSSFNNPYYRRTVELLMEEKGAASVRLCASCHDPVVLFSGRMPDDQPVDMEHGTSQAGITCLSCHAIAGLRDVKGNGRLVMAIPDEYPFARAEKQPGRWIHDTLVRAKPEPHRRAFLKPVHKTAEFCGTCHKVGIPPEVNDYRWKRAQDQYDSWHMSGVSGNTVRSFYLPAEANNCISCHMPLVPSDDQGNDNGFVKDHRFVGANSALPFLNQHGNQLHAVQQKLQSAVVTLDLFRVAINGKVYGPEEALPVMRPPDRVQFSVVVRNRGVGHIFPAGTNDSNEIWLEVRAQDRQGRTVLASGLLDPQGYVDSTAHFFGSKLVNRSSELVAKRDIQNWIATVYSNTISPGTARTVHYEFEVPAGVVIAELSATLNYRKFNQKYHEWVFRHQADEDTPVLPVTTMARTRRQAERTPETGSPLWERWNDYGIGLLLEGDLRGALEAFQIVSAVTPGNPEGPINQARVLIAEGQVERAEKALEQAEKRRPGYLKIAYFRGLVHKAHGDYEEAIGEWTQVCQAYPNDRKVLLDIGRLQYLSGRYDQALTWIDQVLEIDPEDVGGLYNRMLVLGALGRQQEFAKAQRLYEYHKKDETALAVATAFKKRHPMANREAQPIHEHGLRLVTGQPDSSSPAFSSLQSQADSGQGTHLGQQE